MDRSHLNAADFLRRHCHCGFLFVADNHVRCSRTWKTAPESPLARLWLFAWLSSARTDRKGEHPGPRSSLLVWRARLLPWALEWRWFRALLDTDAHRTTLELRIADRPMAGMGLVSRVTPVHTALRNCTRDEEGSFEVGNQVLISSRRKLLWSKATVVNVADEAAWLRPEIYVRVRYLRNGNGLRHASVRAILD
jgi:hypothetical protein